MSYYNALCVGKQPKEPAAAAVRTNEADLQLHVRVESTGMRIRPCWVFSFLECNFDAYML